MQPVVHSHRMPAAVNPFVRLSAATNDGVGWRSMQEGVLFPKPEHASLVSMSKFVSCQWIERSGAFGLAGMDTL